MWRLHLCSSHTWFITSCKWTTVPIVSGWAEQLSLLQSPKKAGPVSEDREEQTLTSQLIKANFTLANFSEASIPLLLSCRHRLSFVKGEFCWIINYCLKCYVLVWASLIFSTARTQDADKVHYFIAWEKCRSESGKKKRGNLSNLSQEITNLKCQKCFQWNLL